MLLVLGGTLAFRKVWLPRCPIDVYGLSELGMCAAGEKMGIAITFVVLIAVLFVSLALTVLVEEFLLKGFFRVVYAQQSRKPQPW